MRTENNGVFERASFSPAEEPASRLGSPAARGDTGTREGYRYRFSPTPPEKGGSRWSPPKRSGRGWSQFSMQVTPSRGKSGSEAAVPAAMWRHPCNPDFTPQRFWKILEEFRQPLMCNKEDDTVLPASLPQIVPKLNLSFLPNAAQPWLGQDEDREGRHHEHMPALGKTGRNRLQRHRNRELAEPGSFPLGSPEDNMTNGQRNSWSSFTSLQRHQHSSSFVATDKELMNLQHRKLGIKPLGAEWDLRGTLQAQDRTLQVAQVAAGAMANQNLEVLDVRGNGLDGVCGSILAAALVNHSRIQTICGLPVREIQSNRIGGIILRSSKKTTAAYGPAEMVLLGSFMIEACCIAKLDLKGIDVGREGFFTLGFGIRTHTCLTHLNLSRTGMRSENFDDMVPALQECTNLSELHLGTNFLDVSAMRALQRLMSNGLRTLRVLGVQNNLLGPSGAVELGDALHDYLTDLDISNNEIGPRGCEIFLRRLKGDHVKMIRRLKLSFNGIDMTVVDALKCALREMRDLTSLKLHSEIPVADVRSKPELVVSGMGFGDLEGVIVAELLLQNVNLRKLDLRGNELGTNAIRNLSTVLVKLVHLQELNNRTLENGIQEEEIQQILGASMHVRPSKRPAIRGGNRSGFDDLKFINKVKEVAAIEERREEENDNYRNIFQEWKKQGLRPETAAVLTDSEEQEDESFLERPPQVKFYKVGRNVRLRQKAPPRAESKKLQIVPTPLSMKVPSIRSLGFKFKLLKARDADSEAICPESSDEERVSQLPQPSTWKSRGSSAAIGTRTNGKRARAGLKLAKLSVDVSSEALEPDRGSQVAGDHSAAYPQAKEQTESKTSIEDLPRVQEENTTQSTPPMDTFKLLGARYKQVWARDRNGDGGVGEDSIVGQGSSIFVPKKEISLSFQKRLAKVRIFGLLGAQGPIRDPVGVATSGNVLTHNRTCCFAGSRMGPIGAKKLANKLSTAPARFASIDLSLCNLTGLDEHAKGEIDQSGFKALCALLRKNKGILSLNLAWNRLRSDVMPFFIPVLQANDSLLSLDLYKNDLEQDGMKILSRCLQRMHYLRELGLRYNRIGPTGAENLAESLPHMSHLVSLDVAGNIFGHAGLKVLAPALAHASQLTRVHLQENEGGVVGNSVLVEYVSHCESRLGELNGLSMSDLIERSEEKLPTTFANYEMLFLAQGFSQIIEGFASIKFWNIHSALSPFLKDVNLGSCRLTSFPEAIFTLTSMTLLDISCNRLTRIPVSKICEHTSLTELICHGNHSLINPPTEIAGQGGVAVILYLKEVLKSGVQDDEVALIAIGAESVGKSSCLSCLVSNGRHNNKTSMGFDESEFEDGTPVFHGEPLFDPQLLNQEELCDDLRRLHIDDRDHSYLTRQGGSAVATMMYWRAADTLQFVVYDLPGHGFYSATNRIFMRRRAVYMLVWRVMDYPSDEAMARGMVSVCRDVTSSMDFVQSLQPGAYCLTVATHTDVADPAVAAEQAKRVFKAIKEKLESMRAQSSDGVCLNVLHDGISNLVSCKKGDGIQMLHKDLIKFTHSNEAFQALCPKGFLRLRNGLRLIRHRSSLINWTAYKRLANTCGVAGEALTVASRMLHERGHLIFCESHPAAMHRNPYKVHLKTMIQIQQRMGVSLKQVQNHQDKSSGTQEISDGKDEDKLMCISPHWLIRVLRGLFNPDVELLIEWFSGKTDKQHANLALLHSTFQFLTRGILEREFVYYLWPCLESPKYKTFWSAYADHGKGPLHAFEGQLVREDFDYDYILHVLEQLHIVARITDKSFWVPCMQTGILQAAIVADARVFKPFRTALCHEVRFNFLPPDFFSVLVTLCSQIRDVQKTRSVDIIDYCSQAAALYFHGDKVQLWVQHATRSPYYSICFNSASADLVQAVFAKLQEMEGLYPGISRLQGEEINPLEFKEVPNICFSYSLHAVPHVEIISQELQKYSSRPRIALEQVAQFSKILEMISVSGTDIIRRRHVTTIGRLRALASENGVLSHDKLGKLGFSDSDSASICNSLMTHSFEGQIVMLCFDGLYSDSSESDWHSVQKHAQGGSQVILVLLPGCQILENLPIKPIAVIDLRYASWNKQGRDLLFPHEARMQLRSMVEPLLSKLLSKWRGLPLSSKDFSSPAVPCDECFVGGELERERFDFDLHVASHYDFMMHHLKTGQTLPDEPPVYCCNHHSVRLADMLSAQTEMTATACQACIEQGRSLPHCFSRRSCLDLLHGKTILPSTDGHGKEEPTGGKLNGFVLACPQCKSHQLDIVDVVQADAFVSYAKKKIKCISCGKGNVTYTHEPTALQPKKHREVALSEQLVRADGKKEHRMAASQTQLPQFFKASVVKAGPQDRANGALPDNTEPSSANEVFSCQDCHLKFGEDKLDGRVERAQNVVGVLEEQLDIVVVKPSILYSLNEMMPAGGPIALKAARSAKIFIAFIDNDYVKSHACMSEFSAAVSASRCIIPVILPGYVSTGSSWHPTDTKYKRSDGIHMVAPFSVLKHFTPIVAREGDSGRGRDSHLARELLAAVCSNLYGGVSCQQRVRNSYNDWKHHRAAVCSSELGKWGGLEQEETDRKIGRVWRRHGSSLNQIQGMRRQLANAGIKTTDTEIDQALREISVTLKTMGSNEFRQFMWNLISNITTKVIDHWRQEA